MKYKRKASKLYHEDITDALSYISNKLYNAKAALKLANEIRHKHRILSANPYINSIVQDPFLASFSIRMQVIKHYLLFYIIDDNEKTIFILRFLYARRDWMNILRNDLENQNYQEIIN